MANKLKPIKRNATVKRFKLWAKLKRKINDQRTIPEGYKEREIWWMSLGHNIGVEEDGKNENFDRPILIVKGFSKYQLWGVPLSTTTKRGKYYYPIVVNGNVSAVLLSQLRTLDTRRFISKYGMLNQKDFAEIKSKLIDYLS